MKIKRSEALFIALTGLITMLICTKSSPLYPVNDWTDANCYMTVGRAITKGKLPYRDLFEHKGPLLYFLHAAGALISDDSFFGVFIFETVACICFLMLFYVLLRKYTGRPALWTVPFISMTVYSSQAFCHGDSAEEFCLPLILSSIMIWLDATESGKAPSDKRAFLMGAFSGIVFWTKFNLLGAYAGAFLVIAVILLKNGIAPLIRMCGFMALGFGAVSFPVIIYFAAHNSLADLWEVYFYDNIFAYGGKKTPVLCNLADGAVFTMRFFPVGSAVIMSGIVAAVCVGRKRYVLYVIASLCTAFAGAFAGHLSYKYYPLILAPFTTFFAVPLIDILRKKALGTMRFSAAFSLILCTAAAFILTPNRYLMKYSRSQLPQYRFAEIINKTEKPSLLNYGFLDGGFYLAAGIIPDQYYFCRNNTELKEMIDSQNICVQAGIPDYVVARNVAGTPPELPGYTCIAEEEFPYYDKNLHYYLFERNEEEYYGYIR